MALWQREWIACARRLQQWEVLADFARACHLNQAELLLESCWKLGEWGAARDALPKALQAAPDAPRLKLCAAYVALSEGRHADVLSADGAGEGLVAQAVALALKEWQRLPQLPSRAHAPLVQLFQQATELAESATIARDVSPATHASAPRHTSALPEVKATLYAWRERLPLPSEDASVWYEVLVWRQQVFALLNQAFSPLIDQNNTVAYLGHHETAWTINRFAHAARKHRLLEACVAALNRIYQLPNIEILDAFTK